MAGMYDPFAHRPYEKFKHRVIADYLHCAVAITESMRDPALDDEWPEWSADW